MGTFAFSAPIARINVISSSKVPSRRELLRIHYFSDPSPLPSSTTTLGEVKVGGITCHMSVAEIDY